MTIYEPSLATESAEYQAFVDKFKPKKTTDDCFTPPAVYDAVLAWAVEEHGLQGREIVRPFWPGGDYCSFDYPDGCVVVDNPPFSIISRIVKFYNAHKVDYFLFAPYLTNFAIRDTNHVVINRSVTYENGAVINTCFVTSMGEYVITTPPSLYKAVHDADIASRGATKKTLPRYEWPTELCAATMLSSFARGGLDFRVRPEDAHWIGNLDGAKAIGKKVFGSGFLLSRSVAAKAAAAKAAVSKDAFTITLSEAEQAIVSRLGGTS
jgi:hypothetical protein